MRHDALSPAGGTASRKMASDLAFFETRSSRHLSDDPPRGVCRHPRTGRKGLLTCGFVAVVVRFTCFRPSSR